MSPCDTITREFRSATICASGRYRLFTVIAGFGIRPRRPVGNKNTMHAGGVSVLDQCSLYREQPIVKRSLNTKIPATCWWEGANNDPLSRFGIVSFTLCVDMPPKRNKPGRSYTSESLEEALQSRYIPTEAAISQSATTRLSARASCSRGPQTSLALSRSRSLSLSLSLSLPNTNKQLRDECLWTVAAVSPARARLRTRHLPSILAIGPRSVCHIPENDVQLSPSTATADNQCGVDIGICVHTTVESSWQHRPLTSLGPRWCSGQNTHLPPRRTGFNSRRGPLSDFRMWESCGTMPLVAWTFSGVSHFPCSFILALLYTQLASPSSAPKTSIFRDAQISSFFTLD
ncbi:hypothetical protein PR048_027687 [Dryococelus australis]|uniref:Uncharacterized protein n=1 Tax=Dryococelus australis TaxID=614101 RepID=A0ABQ9GH82_9NEOP|nr:hypothetical protein PR048_027687 [Dryococelus australis]